MFKRHQINNLELLQILLFARSVHEYLTVLFLQILILLFFSFHVGPRSLFCIRLLLMVVVVVVVGEMCGLFMLYNVFSNTSQ